jgi:nucleoside-diphosphate-sugar epimerase
VPGVVLVTGAAGGLGRALVPVMRAEGWRVRALVHRRPVPEADDTVVGDLLDDAALERAASGVTAVLHLAARTHARRATDYERANVDGTRRLLGAARAAGVERFVHVSTRAIDASGGAYSVTKRMAERLVEDSGMNWVIVRLPEIYGAGAEEGVDEIVARARRGAVIPVVGRGQDRVCPVHVDDVTGALATALTAPPGKVHTLAGECMTVRQFARACVATFGGASRVVGVPVAALSAVSLAARVLPLPLYPDQLARLRAPKPTRSPDAGPDLGFDPRPLADGLRALAS